MSSRSLRALTSSQRPQRPQRRALDFAEVESFGAKCNKYIPLYYVLTKITTKEKENQTATQKGGGLSSLLCHGGSPHHVMPWSPSSHLGSSIIMSWLMVIPSSCCGSHPSSLSCSGSPSCRLLSTLHPPCEQWWWGVLLLSALVVVVPCFIIRDRGGETWPLAPNPPCEQVLVAVGVGCWALPPHSPPSPCPLSPGCHG